MNNVDVVNSERVITAINHLLESKSNVSKSEGLSKEEIQVMMNGKVSNENVDKIVENVKKIIETSDIFNKQVELRYNKDINRVIISIIDKNTHEVLREIPCVELQDLALHLQEAIGVLFDSKA